MSYQVVWLPSARDVQLTVVLSRADRGAVVGVLERLGGRLANEGPLAGESREGEFRVFFELPLAVKFCVDEEQRTATIVDVWSIA